MPLVSIIIPIFNVRSYLCQCLDSVQSQDYSDWECLLIDDGSDDGCADICDEYGTNDFRFRVFHRTHAGVSSSRNIGIEHARGAFLCFIDADDWVGNKYLSDHLLHARASDWTLSGQIREFHDGHITLLVPNSTELYSVSSENTNAFLSLESSFLLFAPHEKLYRTDIIKKYHLRFREDCSYGEDLIFNYQYLMHVKVISTIASAMYHYRIHSDSLSLAFRANQFEEDYAQWLVLKDFHEKRVLWNNDVEAFLAKRLWGIVYDGLFLYPKLIDKTGYLSRILSIPEISLLKKREDVFSCAQWIKKSITHRWATVFYLFFKMNSSGAQYTG